MITLFILLYLAILVSGFWVSRRGKPYNAILLTIHKLVSVAAVVVLGFTVYRVHWEAPLDALQWLVVIVAGLLFLGTIATGALLTAEKPTPPVVLTLHRITPFLTVLASALALYLLLGRTL